MSDETIREGVLGEASKLITGDRNQTYGSPTQNFQDTADVWNVLISHKLKDGEVITPGDVAAFMVALKLVRRKAQSKRDNWVDIAGYAACGHETEVETGAVSDPTLDSALPVWGTPGDVLKISDVLKITANTPEPDVQILKEIGATSIPFLIRVSDKWNWSSNKSPDLAFWSGDWDQVLEHYEGYRFEVVR